MGAVRALPMGLRFVLLLAAILHTVGLGWGLPASDAWDNDGVAPRDVLPGLAETFTPGDYYTYPPLQLALLALLTLPVTALAIARAPSATVSAVVHEIIAVPYMTAISGAARVVTDLMSLGIVVALARIAEEIAGRGSPRGQRIGIFAALVATLGTPFTYYAHTSNIDVPYMFWATSSALEFVRAIARREPARLRGAAVLAALSIATKDQAYALFVVACPAMLAAWATADAWARERRRKLAREALVAAGLAAGVLLVVDGAVVNPSGFRARLGFLSGPASQDFATYTKDLAARVQLVADVAREFGTHYPALFGIFVVLGVAVALQGTGSNADAETARDGTRRLAALVPLALAASFTIAFNLAARRVEERFTLPQMLFAAVYAGFGLDALWQVRGPRLVRIAVRAACVIALGQAAFRAISIDATMLDDPRYQTEAFLAAHVGESDVVEVHGINVYLPRFPVKGRVVRVGPTPPERRGPIPGIEEVQAPLAAIDERRPRFVVVSQCYAWRYLDRDMRPTGGRIYPTGQFRDAADVDAKVLFNGLFAGSLGYRVVHEARTLGRIFPRAAIHGSLGCPVYTFERQS